MADGEDFCFRDALAGAGVGEAPLGAGLDDCCLQQGERCILVEKASSCASYMATQCIQQQEMQSYGIGLLDKVRCDTRQIDAAIFKSLMLERRDAMADFADNSMLVSTSLY